MHIGIKYCGGCRSGYDRAAAADQIRAACPEHRFSFAIPGESYDLLLVICGCTARCANLSALNYRRICMLDGPKGISEALRCLSAGFKEQNGTAARI